jgi:hypothetical protein
MAMMQVCLVSVVDREYKFIIWQILPSHIHQPGSFALRHLGENQMARERYDTVML